MVKRLSRYALLIAGFSLGLLGSVFARMSIDEMLATTEKMLEDSKAYSAIVDKAIEQYNSGNDIEARNLLAQTSKIITAILELSKDIPADYSYYSGQALSEAEKSVLEKINENSRLAEKIHLEATEKINQLGQLANRRKVLNFLADFSSAIERYRKENNKYPVNLALLTNFSPAYIKPLEEVLDADKYSFSYRNLDLEHYELDIEPKGEAINAKTILDQSYHLSQDKKIIIKDASGKTLETLPLR